MLNPKKLSRKPLMNAHWCRALATLLASGLSFDQALIAIKVQAGRNHRLVHACSLALVEVERGASFVEAVSRYHFFNSYQLEQLRISELSGCLPQKLIQIANQLHKKHERNQKLKAQLKFSQAVMVIGLIVGMVFTAVKGGTYIYAVAGLVTVVIVTHWIYRVLDTDVFSILAYAWQHSLLIGNVGWLKRLFEYYWYSLLVLQLDAGIDPVHALVNLYHVFPSVLLKRNTRICQGSLEQGNSLIQALSQGQLILTNRMKQTLWAGEKAGLLTSALKSHLALEEQYLEVIVAAFYEWLPRFYYLIVLSIVLHFII